MTASFFDYLKFDIETRIEDEGRTDLRKQVLAHDFSGAGIIMQNEDVRVSVCRKPKGFTIT
jgi:hypothetical protein